MSSNRRASLPVNSLRRSPRRSRTKTPSVNELSNKYKISPRGKRRLEFRQEKPLRGRTFYFDLQGHRSTNALQTRIKNLGGTIEEFLSKDINFLVTNRKDVDTRCSPRSHSTPSPGLSVPSPHPGNAKSSSAKGSAVPSPLSAELQCYSADQAGQVAPKHDTRGKALAKQAAITYKYGTSNVIANARNWGLQIYSVERLLEKLEQYRGLEKKTTEKPLVSERVAKQSVKAKSRMLNAPFLKVEDHSRSYKPLVHELKEWPMIYFDSPLGSCPFDSPKTEVDNEQEEQAKTKRKQVQEVKFKKKGFCECCCLHYEDLDLHLRSDRHQSFARDSSNYRSLDEVISRGQSLQDFLAKMTAKHRETEKEKREQSRTKKASSETSLVNIEEKTPTKRGQKEMLDNCQTPVDSPEKDTSCHTPSSHAPEEGVQDDNTPTRVTRSRASANKFEEEDDCKKGDYVEPPSSPRTPNSLKEMDAASKETDSSQSGEDEATGQDTEDSGAETRVTRARTRSASVSPGNNQKFLQVHENPANQSTVDSTTEAERKSFSAQKREKYAKEQTEDGMKVVVAPGSSDQSSNTENYDPSLVSVKEKAATRAEDHVDRLRLRSAAAHASQSSNTNKSSDHVKQGCHATGSVRFAPKAPQLDCSKEEKESDLVKQAEGAVEREQGAGRTTRSRLESAPASVQQSSSEDDRVKDNSDGWMSVLKGSLEERVVRATRSRAQSALASLHHPCGTRDSEVSTIGKKEATVKENTLSRLRSPRSPKGQKNSEDKMDVTEKLSPAAVQQSFSEDDRVENNSVSDKSTSDVQETREEHVVRATRSRAQSALASLHHPCGDLSSISKKKATEENTKLRLRSPRSPKEEKNTKQEMDVTEEFLPASVQQSSSENDRVKDNSVSDGSMSDMQETREKHVVRATRSRAQSALASLYHPCGTSDGEVSSNSNKEATIEENNTRSRFRSPRSPKGQKNSEEEMNVTEVSPSRVPRPQKRITLRKTTSDIDCSEENDNKKPSPVVETEDERGSFPTRIRTRASKDITEESAELIGQEETTKQIPKNSSRGAQLAPKDVKVKLSDCRRSRPLQRPVLETESDDSGTESIQPSDNEHSSARSETLSDVEVSSGLDSRHGDESSTTTLEGSPSSPCSEESEGYSLRRRSEPKSPESRLRKRTRFQDNIPDAEVKEVHRGNSRRKNTTFTGVKNKTCDIQRQRSKSAGSSANKATEKKQKQRSAVRPATEKTPRKMVPSNKDVASESDFSTSTGSPRSGPSNERENSYTRASSLRSAVRRLEGTDILDSVTTAENNKEFSDDRLPAAESPYSKNVDISMIAVCGSPRDGVTRSYRDFMKSHAHKKLQSVDLSCSSQKEQAERGANRINDPLTQLFDSDNEQEDFYGFEVPQFDRSFSSEGDHLSLTITSIVENLNNGRGGTNVVKEPEHVRFEQVDVKAGANKIETVGNGKEENKGTYHEKSKRTKGKTEKVGYGSEEEWKKGTVHEKSKRTEGKTERLGNGKEWGKGTVHEKSERANDGENGIEEGEEQFIQEEVAKKTKKRRFSSCSDNTVEKLIRKSKASRSEVLSGSCEEASVAAFEDDYDDDGDDEVFAVAGSSDGEQEEVAASPFSFTSWRHKRKSEDPDPDIDRPAKRRKSRDQGNDDQLVNGSACHEHSRAETPVKRKLREENCAQDGKHKRPTGCKSRLSELLSSKEREVVQRSWSEHQSEEKRTQNDDVDGKPSSFKSRLEQLNPCAADEVQLDLPCQEWDINQFIGLDTDVPVFETMEERIKLRRLKSKCNKERNDSLSSARTRGDAKTTQITRAKSSSSITTEEEPKLPPLKPLKKRYKPLKPLKEASPIRTSLRARAQSTPTSTPSLSPTQSPLAMPSGSFRKATWIYKANEFSSPPSATKNSGGKHVTSTPASRKKLRPLGASNRANEGRKSSRLSKQEDPFAFVE